MSLEKKRVFVYKDTGKGRTPEFFWSGTIHEMDKLKRNTIAIRLARKCFETNENFSFGPWFVTMNLKTAPLHGND